VTCSGGAERKSTAEVCFPLVIALQHRALAGKKGELLLRGRYRRWRLLPQPVHPLLFQLHDGGPSKPMVNV